MVTKPTTVDPICAMEVRENPALSETFRGQTYYFCSEDCRNQFRTDPEGYAKLREFERQGPRT